MAAPFICKDCGAPRQYINQYCPNCESIGPHIPVSKSGKAKNTRAEYSAVRTSKRSSDTFAEELDYGKERRIKRRTAGETRPKKERAPRPEKRASADWSAETAREQRPATFSFHGRTVLYGTFVIMLGVLVALIVINTNNTGINPPPIDSNTITTSQEPVATGNTTASSNPVTAPTDNETSPASVTPPIPEDTTWPKLVGDRPDIIPSDRSAILAWKTDEKSKSTVEYGTTNACELSGPDETAFKVEHNMYISGLSPDTLYYYRVIATDESNNSGVIAESSFRTEHASNTAPYPGSKAPEITLKTLEGKQVSLSQFRGKKVILNFWASWCTPCKIELPHLQDVWEKYLGGNEVTVITVAGGESDENEIRSFIAAQGYTFPVLLDSTESTFNRYNLTSIPKTFFIDKSGIIKQVKQGMFTSPGEIEFMLSSF